MVCAAAISQAGAGAQVKRRVRGASPVDTRPGRGNNHCVTRSLLLAISLLSGTMGRTRLVRFARRKSAYFATLLVRPDEYCLFGLLDGPDGIDLLWRRCAGPGARA